MKIPPRHTNNEKDSAKEASVHHGLAWLLISVGLVALALFSLPLIAKKIPWRFEEKIFENTRFFESETECRGNELAKAKFDQVLKRIYPILASDYEFSIHARVIHGKEVNAFTFLAGNIFIYDGLIQQAESAEELAAIIAHEIEHVRLRHVTQGMVQRTMFFFLERIALPSSSLGNIPGLLGVAARLKFSRGQEADADTGALERLNAAHVNVDGFKKFFQKRTVNPSRLDIFSDHPSDQSRAQAANAYLKLPSTPILSADEWKTLKEYCRRTF